MYKEHWRQYREMTEADAKAKRDAVALIEKLRQRRAALPTPAGAEARDEKKAPLRA